MKAIITGATGLLGRRLAERLATPGTLVEGPLDLILSDVRGVRSPAAAGAGNISIVQGDLRDPQQVAKLVGDGVDFVFHLAAVMSAAAEENFQASWGVNITILQNLFEALQAVGSKPRLVYASSAAVYGPGMPDNVPDGIGIRPQSSYGAQKAIAELLIDDYTRRGLVDGWSLRLGHVVVRDDATHRGAGAFITAIVREPLSGRSAICPVSRETIVGVISPETVVSSLIHAAKLPKPKKSGTRVVQLPVTTVAVGDIVDAVRRVGGAEATDRIQWKRDADLDSLLTTIPARFAADRARDLSFPPTLSIDEILAEYVANQKKSGGV